MVRKFTEEERLRQKESTERHYEKYHSGERAGTPCNGYAECSRLERAEWAEQSKRDNAHV